ITDGVNVSAPATITILMDTPNTPQVEPTSNVVFSGGESTANGSAPVTVSTEGQGSVQLPVLTPTADATATPTGPNSTYLVSVKWNSPVILSGACDPKGCPTSATLTGTAILPSGFTLSTSGNLFAALRPSLLFQPLWNLWQVGPYDDTFGMFGRVTGFLPVTLGSNGVTSDPSLPAGYAGLFSFLLSCQNLTVDVNCPKPNVVHNSPGGGVLYVEFPIPGPSTTPNGCATPQGNWSVGSPIPVKIDLSFTTPDATGTITVTIWHATPQGPCSTGTNSDTGWQQGLVQTVLTLPAVHGPGTYGTTWTPSTAGPYIIGATYSGDFKNTTSTTHFNVFNVNN